MSNGAASRRSKLPSSIVPMVRASVYFLLFSCHSLTAVWWWPAGRRRRRNSVSRDCCIECQAHHFALCYDGRHCLGRLYSSVWIIIGVICFVVLQAILLSNVTLDLNQFAANATASEEISPELIQRCYPTTSSFDFGGMTLAFIFYFILAYFCHVYATGLASDDMMKMWAKCLCRLRYYSYLLSTPPFTRSRIPMVRSRTMGAVLTFYRPQCDDGKTPIFTSYVADCTLSHSDILTTIAPVWASAKVFRVTLLMYGKKPTFKEMMRWITYR